MHHDVLKRTVQALLKKKRSELGLTLAQVGAKLHVGSTYTKLEAGILNDPSEELLRLVGELYGLNRHEHAWLTRATRGHDPREPLHSLNNDEIHGSWQRVIDGQRHMVYATNHQWRVVIHNAQWPLMFPRGSVTADRCNIEGCDRNHPDDVMRWMMTDPRAREVLTDWETAWAPLVAPALGAARLVYRNDEYLAESEELVRNDPQAGPIYDAFASIRVDLDGSVRPVNHGLYGPGWLTLCTSAPLTCVRFQGMTIIFDRERPAPLPPVRVPL